MKISTQHIEWLNTAILPNINYWTILHLIYGMLWGFTKFNIFSFVVLHIFLEAWEIYTFSHMDTSTYEILDILIDMVAGVVGWVISNVYCQLSYIVITGFASKFLLI